MDTTDRYKQTLRRANQVAARSGHATIEPEDLALSLSESTGVAACAIQKQGCNLRRLRQRIIDHFHVPQKATEGFISKAIGLLRSVTTGKRLAAEKTLEPGEVTAKVLAIASREAETLRCHYVGTEHLLLGLLREGGPVASFLQAEGITYDGSRETILSLLSGKQSKITSILTWVGLILFSPLYSFLFIFGSIYWGQLLYVMAFRVVNRTSRPIWITPVGTFDSGRKSVLDQFVTGFPALPAFQERNHRVRPGGSKWIHFNRKGLSHYEIVVGNAEREFRQLAIHPIPSKENLYRRGDNEYIVEEWIALAPVAGDVLAAAHASSRAWLLWVLFFVGFAVFVFYCWLLG